MYDMDMILVEGINGEPKEHYRFQFDPKRIDPVEDYYLSMLYNRMIFSFAAGILLIVVGAFIDRIVMGMGIALLLISTAIHIKSVIITKMGYRASKKRFLTAVYDYRLYDGFLLVTICTDKGVNQMKLEMTDIQKVRIISDFVVLEIQGKIYLLEKSALNNESFFLEMVKE